jgi:uroporphyrinogen-III synthase
VVEATRLGEEVKWVLTRTAEEGRALADELGCELLPCIERVALPWPPWPKAAVVFVTSKAVAQRLISEPRPQGLRIAAVAPATRAVLEAAGLGVDISATGGAVALAEAVQRAGPTDTFYPTSDAGVEQPEQAAAVAVLESLGQVHRHVVYEVRAPKGLADQLRALGPRGFIFFSPSAVAHVAAAGVVPQGVVCVGASTVRAAKEQAGWPAPVVASGEDGVRKALS